MAGRHGRSHQSGLQWLCTQDNVAARACAVATDPQNVCGPVPKHEKFQLAYPSFAGLVVLAGSLNPIPSRTRPLNSPAPMVLSLKTWESRSLPGLPRTDILITMKESGSPQ
jgi:hypothetical protein